jgi:DNA repair exonuclease SbcCD nuclease subunit
MKILATGDWHLDAHTAGVPRFDDVKRAIEQTVQAAAAEQVDLYLFMGDLSDPDRGRAFAAAGYACEIATRLLLGWGIASVWLTGNHDVVEDGSGASTLSPLAGVARSWSVVRGGEDLVVADGPLVLPCFLGRQVDVIALPFTPFCRSYDPAVFLREAAFVCRSPRVLIAGHLNLEGITPGSETLDMPRGRDVFFPIEEALATFGDRAILLNGHYHERQVYRGVQVVGSLERLGFGELRNEPGYLLVEVNACAA